MPLAMPSSKASTSGSAMFVRAASCVATMSAPANCSELAADARPASRYGKSLVVTPPSTSFITPTASVMSTA